MNLGKCKFHRLEAEFSGHRISSKGIQPLENK